MIGLTRTSKLSFVAFVSLALLVPPALASWEGTEWDMSPSEVLAAVVRAREHSPASSEAFVYDGRSFAPLVKAEHEIAGIAGEAALLFDANEALRSVLFSPAQIDACATLGEALTDRHGAVETTGFGSTEIFNWEDTENTISFTSSADLGICNLSYAAP